MGRRGRGGNGERDREIEERQRVECETMGGSSKYIEGESRFKKPDERACLQKKRGRKERIANHKTYNRNHSLYISRSFFLRSSALKVSDFNL